MSTSWLFFSFLQLCLGELTWFYGKIEVLLDFSDHYQRTSVPNALWERAFQIFIASKTLFGSRKDICLLRFGTKCSRRRISQIYSLNSHGCKFQAAAILSSESFPFVFFDFQLLLMDHWVHISHLLSSILLSTFIYYQ